MECIFARSRASPSCVLRLFLNRISLTQFVPEPALNALGISVEKVTNGGFPKAVVMYRCGTTRAPPAPTWRARFSPPVLLPAARRVTVNADPPPCSVAVGVAIGISAGVLKILQGWNLTYMLLITYAIAIALTVKRFRSARACACVATQTLPPGRVG